MRLLVVIVSLLIAVVGGVEDIVMELPANVTEPSEQPMDAAYCNVTNSTSDDGGGLRRLFRRRRLAPGKIINNSGVTLTCRPENPPPATITVPPGGTANIDAICPTAGCPGKGKCCVLKVTNGCTATVTGAGPPLTVSITCSGRITRCIQYWTGGYVNQWW